MKLKWFRKTTGIESILGIVSRDRCHSFHCLSFHLIRVLRNVMTLHLRTTGMQLFAFITEMNGKMSQNKRKLTKSLRFEEFS